MKRSLRNSIFTMLAVLSFGVALSATRLNLPALSRSVAVAQEQSAVPARAEEMKNVDEIELPALRAALDAKIQADKADYLPGEVVVFTGSGWEPGESVSITIHEEPALHADRKLSVIADELGRIFDNQFVPETHELGVIFIVKARGLSSGGAASTMAAQAKPAANIDQCANGGVGGTPVQCAGSAWQNGNLGQSQAHYNEGESVPYRASFTSLASGQSYTATIEWDTTQSGKHALDYLTNFNRTETTADPCTGISGVPSCSSPTTFPIPADPNVTAANGFGGSQIPGNFTLYNGTISGVSAYTLVGTYAGSSSTRITLTFAPTSAGTAVLAWGGHIATRVDWGLGFSAVAISGSPFHMRLVGFTCSNVANCGVGQQDRSLSSEAVVFPATLTIVKDVANSSGTSYTDPTDFSFTTSGTQVASFSLDDDADVTLSNTKTFGSITDFASTRTVTEANPSPTFALTALTCSVVSQQSQPGTATANLATRTATFLLKEAEAATCTFVNTLQNGTLRVIKSVTNDNGGNAAASDFTVHVKSGGTDVSGSPQAGSATGTVYSLASGSYTVSENDPTSLGYAQGAFSGDCNSSTGVVTVVAGAEKTCTITNNDVAPKLTLIKSVTNDNGGNAGIDDFGLSIGGNATTSGTKVTLNSNQAYAINEAGLTGYSFVSITGNAKCPAVLGGTVTLDEGDDISCTITNTDVGPKLTLIKSVTNDNGGNAGVDDFGLSIGGNATTSGTKVTVNANQAYPINEAGLTGYTFVSITGNAKCPAVLGGTVTLDEGDDISCTITNDDVAPKLALIKSVTNDNGGNAGVDDFGLSIGGNATTSGTKVTLNANQAYAINEAGLTGYSFVSITGNAKCPAVLGGTVTLDEGDDISCTITNTDVGPKLTLIKSVTNDNGGNAGVDDFGLSIGGNATTSGTKVTVNANQAYPINEAGLTGYTFVSVTGNAKCPAVLGGTVTLDEGDDISCTITNDDVAPKLALIKSVINDNGGEAGPNHFGLSIGGNATTSGTKVTVNANQAYPINEAGLTGYSFVSITGNAKCPAVLGGTVTLDEGDDISCTITNDDSQRATNIQTIMSWTLKDAVDLGNDLVRGGTCGAAGTITLSLYRHDLGTPKADLTCDATSKVWESAALPEVDGKASDSHDVEEDGIYLWVAVYSGDNCNTAVTSDCGREVTEITDEDLTPESASPICTPAS